MFWKGRIRKGRAEQSEAKTVQWTVFRTRLGGSISAKSKTDESEAKIDNYEYSTNTYLQKGKMVDAYSNAVEKAAGNPSGALGGVMGIGVLNMTSDGVIKDVANKAFGHSEENNGECPNCKEKVEKDAKFCSKCGKEL